MSALASLGFLATATTTTTTSAAAAATPPQAAAPHPAAASSPRIAFAPRYQAVQHGGIARAANAAISCRGTRATAPGSCASVRKGSSTAANDAFDMFYSDVDHDPNTYNSTRAHLRLPTGSQVSYARLYWGGNLRVGEQKPPEDNGRVLIAEPGGRYKALLADTAVGHRVAHGAEAFQASADVTRLVRANGSGLYTVAQINVARGHSTAGAWGGWTLVVAYQDDAAPLRRLAVWDGFGALEAGRRSRTVRLDGVRPPAGATGTAGLVAYDGDPGTKGDTLLLSAGHHRGTPLSGPHNPADDVLNSTLREPGRAPARKPAYARTLGYDSDVFDLHDALAVHRGHGADRLGLRLSASHDTAWAGVLFLAVDTRAHDVDSGAFGDAETRTGGRSSAGR